MKQINRLCIFALLAIGTLITAEAATVRVTGGTLYLAGNKLWATNFLLGNSATLNGSGEIRAPATLAGTISPGSSAADIGTLSFSDRIVFDSGTFVCYAATDASLDRISVTGSVTGAATVQMSRAAGASPLQQVIIKGGTASDYTSFTVSPSTEWVLDEAGALDLVVSYGQLPATPQNVSASDGTYLDKVAVTWSAASGATGYQVWRNTVNNSSSATLIETTAQTSYNDFSGAVGVLYYYWIKATNAIGASAFSSSASGWRTSLADPVMVDSAGNWYVWISGSGYQMIGPFYLGLSGTPVAGDFDGDRYTDPALVDQNSGVWRVWFSSLGYQMGGPWNLGVPGIPVAADFDGDQYTDPAMVNSAGAWHVWLTSQGYQMAGPFYLGVSGTPVAADFDGDGYADPVVVVNSAWYLWLTSLGYQMSGPWDLGMSGTPVAADFDGDGYAEPAVVVNGAWYVWFTSQGYQMAGPFYLGVSGTPVAGDFDGQ